MSNANSFYFPFESFRENQEKLLSTIFNTISQKENLLVSAPTGTGKTIAGLGPALKFAEDNYCKVIYLTSRSSQADQVLETLQKINLKYKKDFNATSFIGKAKMCINSGKNKTKDIYKFCKNSIDSDKCIFYSNFKEIGDVNNSTLGSFFISNKTYIDYCYSRKVCPHKINFKRVKDSRIIIADYNYFFNNNLQDLILEKAEIQKNQIVLIVDEAHNLPDRMKNIYSVFLDSSKIKEIKKELEVFKFLIGQKEEILIINLLNIIENLIRKETNKIYEKDFKISKTLLDSQIKDFNKVIKKIELAISLIRNNLGEAYEEEELNLDSLLSFLKSWNKEESLEFIRTCYSEIILDKGKEVENHRIQIKCIIAREIIKDKISECHSCIMMSGSLVPIDKFAFELGIDLNKMIEIPSCFPLNNVKYICYSNFSSLYKERENNYYNFAKKLLQILNQFKRNSFFFFPSYAFADEVYNIFSNLVDFRYFDIFLEKDSANDDIIRAFEENNNKPQVLFAVIGGSFYEGIDFPGRKLEVVVLVGFSQLGKTVETEELEQYYQKKNISDVYGYTYIYPKLNQSIQAIGRCIRKEDDKGLVFLLEERFNKYANKFPSHINIDSNVDLKSLENWFGESEIKIEFNNEVREFIKKKNLDELNFISGYFKVTGKLFTEESEDSISNNLNIIINNWLHFKQYFKKNG